MSRIKDKIALAVYKQCYKSILENNNVDLIDVSYFTLPDNLKNTVLAFKANLPRKTPIHAFVRNVRSLAIQNEWRSELVKTFRTTFDFSENTWPIHHFNTAKVFLGLTRDYEIGKAVISVGKHRQVMIEANINAEHYADNKEFLNDATIGIGYIEAPGPSIRIMDIYFK